MFKLEIETDNAAFSDGFVGIELKRILQKVIRDIESFEEGRIERTLLDINGNVVGGFELSYVEGK